MTATNRFVDDGEGLIVEWPSRQRSSRPSTAVTLNDWLNDWAHEAHNPYHDERGRFTHAPGNRAGGGAVAVDPISRSDLSNPDTPRSRAVSRDEFDRIARRGQERLAELRRNARPTTDGIGDDARWNEVKDSSWEAVQEEWGGATIDAHTGEPIEGTPSLYAMSVKPPGMQSVRIPIGSDRASFDAAMDEARARFATQLTYDQFHLGVFRDEDIGGIDIDPVLIVDNIGDVESIGAFTHAVGGAYNFADGNGYWPPHIEE